MRNTASRFIPLALLAMLVPATPLTAEGPGANRPHWNNIKVIRENVESPRAHFIPFSDREMALKGDLEASEFFLSLNGIWKFH